MVYASIVDLEGKEQTSKDSCTGLMRHLISLWYPQQRLAVSYASKGINERIRTAVFSKIDVYTDLNYFGNNYNNYFKFTTEYCLNRFPSLSADKLMRDGCFK